TGSCRTSRLGSVCAWAAGREGAATRHRAQTSSAMSTVRLRAPSRFDRIVELETPDADWDDLARRSGNIFATKEWLSPWGSHFGRGDPLVLPVHDADGTLLAILPLYTWSRRPLRVLRFLGHGAGD